MTWAEHGIEIPAGASGEVDTTCPECSPTRRKKSERCLSVNVDEGVWTCHHCGWAGSLSRKREKVYKRPAPVCADLPQKVLEWFKSRGISQATLARNRIGAGKVFMPQAGEEVSAIHFPYYRGEDLINVKHRDGKKNFRMEAGAERILYGLNDLSNTTIIVEGEMDKLSMEEAGFKNCVSVPDGAPSPNTKNYASKFSFFDESAKAVEEWIIAVDGDEPGKRLEEELARRFGREKCRRVVWPEGCKDANDVLVKHGSLKLTELVENAQPYPINGVFSVADVQDRIISLYENGWDRGVGTGWDNLTHFYRVRPGSWTVVTGIPGSGKSNWLDNLMVNIGKAHGWVFALFSPENQPIEDHIARIMQIYANRPFHEGPTLRMEESLRDQALRWVDEHFLWILPDDDAEWTLDAVLERAAVLVYRKGIRGLVIDPWNELEHVRPGGMSETEHISRSLKRIRVFARRYGVHVWVIAHPAKLYRDKEGNYPVPTPYDISGSAHWRNKADCAVCVWRDMGDYSKPVEVHVQKIRFKQDGQIGSVELDYDRVTGAYKQLPTLYGQREAG